MKKIVLVYLLMFPTISNANSIGEKSLNNLILITMLTPIILSILSYIIWCIYGKDIKYNVNNKSEIPHNINPLDLSILYNEKATEKDVFYLLIHLANTGYIKIIENTNNNFAIEKIKEYDGNNKLEERFLKSLFKKEIVISLFDYLNSEKNKEQKSIKKINDQEIKIRFEKAKNNILYLIENSGEKYKYFEKKSDSKKKILVAMIAIILVMITSLPVIAINKLEYISLSLIISIFSLFALINFVQNIEFRTIKEKINFFTIFAISLIIIMIMPIFTANKEYIYTFLIGYMCVAIILFFYKYMSKRNSYGTKKVSEFESLKHYLINVKTEELNLILKENKNYLYDILAYSYILNINSTIFKNIKELNLKKPNWYIINGEFTVQKFSNSLNRLYRKIKTNENEEG